MTDTAAPAPAARQFSLGDRYTTESGEILATGVQALARLPMDQMRADRRAGLDTAAFISGYQGSPLGGYDRELQSQRALLDELRIVHRPALNEELGATAVMGSQVAQTFASAPLRRRARHLVRQVPRRRPRRRRHPPRQLRGDGPPRRRARARRRRPGLQVVHAPVRARRRRSPRSASSCSTPARCRRSSTSACTAWRCPGPAACGPRSRSSRPSPTARAPPLVDPDRIRPVVPTLEIDGRPWSPTLTSNIMTPSLEAELLGPRTEMALRYIAENDLNRIIVDTPRPWLGIVAGGHACEQVMEALAHARARRDRPGRGRRARAASSARVTVRRAVRPPARRRHLDRPRRRGQVAQRRDAGAATALYGAADAAAGAGQAGRRGPAADPPERRTHRRGAGRAAAAAC